MGVHVKYYLGQPGQYTITDLALFNATILKVSRNDNVYKKVSANPSQGLEFSFDPSASTISFNENVPFNGPTVGRPNRNAFEKIKVKYKT